MMREVSTTYKGDNEKAKRLINFDTTTPGMLMSRILWGMEQDLMEIKLVDERRLHNLQVG